jgi:hypothetical protein
MPVSQLTTQSMKYLLTAPSGWPSRGSVSIPYHFSKPRLFLTADPTQNISYIALSVVMLKSDEN